MSKAEDKSEQYRAFREQCGIKDPIMLNEIEEACYEGYHQAEKDLALSWKDIADILDVTDVIANDDSMEERLKTMSEEEYCKEVLKRFNESRTNKY